MPGTLSSYPYVIVRLGCEGCRRKGSYRLARLAARFGAEIDLDSLLARLTVDCEFANPRHPYQGRCRARFIDLDPPQRPPDMPPAAQQLRVVNGGKR
jgi:hypothetical protein